MSKLQIEDAELSPTSPILSPGEESDQLAVQVYTEPKPGLDGKPVRCELFYLACSG